MTSTRIPACLFFVCRPHLATLEILWDASRPCPRCPARLHGHAVAVAVGVSGSCVQDATRTSPRQRGCFARCSHNEKKLEPCTAKLLLSWAEPHARSVDCARRHCATRNTQRCCAWQRDGHRGWWPPMQGHLVANTSDMVRPLARRARALCMLPRQTCCCSWQRRPQTRHRRCPSRLWPLLRRRSRCLRLV